MAETVIYTRDWCGYCAAAKRLLAERGVAFEERNASSDPSLREEMIGRSGRMTFPQIFIGGTHVGGSDDLHALDRAGKLRPLLSSEGIA